jgi:membrane associated rhomboid family serine protease
MIPFQDNIPSRRFPTLTVALIILNTLLYLFEASLGSSSRERFIFRFGLIPLEFQLIGKGPTTLTIQDGEPDGSGQPSAEQQELEGTWTGALLPLVTSMFLHGGWLHLIGNMWFLWLFGDNVEDRLGHMRFLLLYVTSGLMAGATQVIVNWGEATPIIGASGAVAGVLGAYMVTYPYARVRTLVPFFYFFWPVVELPAFVLLGLWLLLQFFQGTMALSAPGSSSVAWWAHVGGFVAGIVLVRLLAPVIVERSGPKWNEVSQDSD